jgi:hypothetical protein
VRVAQEAAAKNALPEPLPANLEFGCSWMQARARAAAENRPVSSPGLDLPSKPFGTPARMEYLLGGAWSDARDRARAAAALEVPEPSPEPRAEHGSLPPHVLLELGFHPSLLSATHRTAFLTRALRTGLVTREEIEANTSATFAALPYRMPVGWWAEAIDALRHAPISPLPVYRNAVNERRAREEAYVRRALQEGILTKADGALGEGHDRLWSRLGMRIRSATPGSDRARFFDQDPGPIDLLPGENLSLLALDLHLRGVEVGLIDLCSWSVVWRDVARTWVMDGGEPPVFLRRCPACMSGAPYAPGHGHEDRCLDTTAPPHPAEALIPGSVHAARVEIDTRADPLLTVSNTADGTLRVPPGSAVHIAFAPDPNTDPPDVAAAKRAEAQRAIANENWGPQREQLENGTVTVLQTDPGEPFYSDAVVVAPEHAGEIKRGRGRPPGSKTKKLSKKWMRARERAHEASAHEDRAPEGP